MTDEAPEVPGEPNQHMTMGAAVTGLILLIVAITVCLPMSFGMVMGAAYHSYLPGGVDLLVGVGPPFVGYLGAIIGMVGAVDVGRQGGPVGWWCAIPWLLWLVLFGVAMILVFTGPTSP